MIQRPWHPARRVLIAIAVCLWMTVAQADNWFWIDAKVNGKPVRLALDTACSPSLVLFQDAAQRLGLKLHEAEKRTPDQMPFWLTEECTIKLPWSFWRFARARWQLVVVDVPSDVLKEFKMDGLVGWPILRDRILELDAGTQKFRFLRKVPKAAAGWTRLGLRTDVPVPVLALDLPNADGSKGVLIVDTGAGATGVELSPRRWKEWKAIHTNRTTLIAKYNSQAAHAGRYAYEQAWADRFSLGPLEMTDVLVEEPGSFFSQQVPDYAGTLGMEALRRLDLIVDGKHGMAYLRPKQTPSAPSEHNQLGAVFVPRDDRSDELLAHVLEGSPAFEAGIRNGDVLLKIGDRDVTNWTDPGRFDSPAGTRLELTVKRGQQTLKTTVVLREILGREKRDERALPTNRKIRGCLGPLAG